MDNPITAALGALTGTAKTAAKPERSEPGPGDVGPTTETKDGQLVTMEMSEEELAEWWKRIERARQRVKAREDKWDILLNEYLPNVSKSGEAETVKVQGHFRNVHSKIGQLFYRSPDLIMTAKDPGPAQNEMPNPMNQQLPPGAEPLPPLTMEDIISIKQAVLTEKLGRDGIKANRLMDELLFDVLAWAGQGCSKLGYRCIIKNIEKPMMAPAPPVPQPGQMLGLGAPPTQLPPQPMIGPDGKPVMESIPVPIYEDYYWRRFSPKKLLVNDDLRSTRFDEDATYMGMEFFMSPKAAMKAFELTEEEVSKAAEDDRVHDYAEDKQGGQKPPGLVHGVELWVKASVFTDEPHPQVMYQLVLIEGLRDRPVVWRLSPDQTIDPETGKLSNDSLIGFPIRVLAIRDLADSCFPMSDSAFTNSEIKQLSTWRRQSIKIRDAAIGKYFYDQGSFDEAEVKILQDGDVGAYIGVAEGKLSQGADKIFTTTAQIHATQDDYRGAMDIKQDISETLGISAVGAGAPESTVRSATETHAVQSSMQARNDKELARTVDFYLDGARMIDQLLMRYATEMDYVTVAGENGARRMMAWNNKFISGKYLYDIAPDSQLRIDTAQDFQLDLNFYNQAAKDPLFNRSYWLRRLARMRGADPAKALIDPSQLPKPEPEKPKISLALSGMDLMNPLVIDLLVQLKVIPPQEAPAPDGTQPGHGGANTPGETISQHSASNSGGAENAPGAMNARQMQVK